MMPPSALLRDGQSRGVLREFVIQAGIGLALMVVLYVVRAQTIPELGQAAVRVFSFYSIIDCARAMARREEVWGPSLSRWDQAAAYSLCATFCSLLLEWQQ